MNADSPVELLPAPRLLFDENLSARLVRLLAETYPNSAHLQDLGLLGATDRVVWTHAGSDGFVLVTKDEDFHRLSVMYGPPPKVVLLRTGNSTTREIADTLIVSADAIRMFVREEHLALFAIG